MDLALNTESTEPLSHSLTTAATGDELLARAQASGIAELDLCRAIGRHPRETRAWSRGDRPVPPTVRRVLQFMVQSPFGLETLLSASDAPVEDDEGLFRGVEATGTTQADFADAIDRTPEEITRWACGRRPLPRTIRVLCQAIADDRRVLPALLQLAAEDRRDGLVRDARERFAVVVDGVVYVEEQGGPRARVELQPPPSDREAFRVWAREARGAYVDVALARTLRRIERIPVQPQCVPEPAAWRPGMKRGVA